MARSIACSVSRLPTFARPWKGKRAAISSGTKPGARVPCCSGRSDDQVSGKASAVKPFAHALFGGVRLGPSGFTTTAFAVLVGGGFDIGSGRLAWRAVQADWMITHVAGFTDKNNVRVSTGLVFRF